MTATARPLARLFGLSAAFVLTLAMTFPAPAAVLQGSWHLDETTGTTAFDSSPFGRDGTYLDSPTTGQTAAAPAFGTAYGFDGVNDGINLGSAFNFANDFTITAWVNHNLGAGDLGFIFTHATGGAGYGFRISGTTLTFTTFGIQDYHSTAVVPANTWTHVAVVFDSSNDANFYVNGALIQTVTGSAPAITTGTGDFHIAERAPFMYTGLIDEVNIFTGALTAEEIGVLMTTQTLPEPSAALLMLSGVAVLMRRRRQ